MKGESEEYNKIYIYHPPTLRHDPRYHNHHYCHSNDGDNNIMRILKCLIIHNQTIG